MMRTRDSASGPASGLEADGGAVALMVELLSDNSILPDFAPLAADIEGRGIQVWSYRQATAALRQVAVSAGLNTKDVSLHSLRISVATVLGVGGDTLDRVIHRKCNVNQA